MLPMVSKEIGKAYFKAMMSWTAEGWHLGGLLLESWVGGNDGFIRTRFDGGN